jgi:hypothetical protein
MRILLSLFVTLIVGSTLVAADSPVWPTPTNEQKPWTRWWWLGSAVTPAEITRSLEEFKAAGLGGVEICPIYGAKGAEEKYIDFLTPKWMAMLAHTTNEAKRLGLGVDLTTGTGWPFGGPGVTAADASAKVVVQKYDVDAGKRLTQALPAGTLRALVAYPAEGKPVDLTTKVKDGKLDWVAPEGTWKLYAAVQQSPVMKVKRAAPGGVGNVLDPFSTAKLDRYLAGFDKAFAGYTAPMPRAFFHDSYEYYNANWTDNLFAEFQKRRGYDLKDHLPELIGDGPADNCARVKCDYRETISDLHREYVERWTAWCHKHGALSRNQAHGGPGNILDAYAAADIPECEIYTRYEPRHRPFLKMASSAAHLTGRNLASAESFTWLREHFQTPLSAIKPAADFLFLSGVNHLVYHGTPFSPGDAPWPGWQFYASVNFGPQGGLWRDLPAFNAYVARVQSVLQAGKPANDVLLYVPFHDFWQSNDNAMHKTFAMPGTWMESHPVHAVAMELERKGYAFDEVSDRLLESAMIRDNKIVIAGNQYKSIIVPSCKVMPLSTMKKILSLFKDGGTVAFLDAIPIDVPGLRNLTERRAELKRVEQSVELTKEDEGLFLICPANGGSLVVAKTVDHLIRYNGGLFWLGWQDGMMTYGVHCARRKVEDGYQYFICNQSDKAIDRSVSIAPSSPFPISAELFDPIFPDRSGRVEITGEDEDPPRFHLQLLPGESRLLRTYTTKIVSTKPWHYTQPAGMPVDITGTWNVQFLEGGPVLPKSYETANLKSWTTRNDPELKRFAGTAKYSITFEKPNVVGATDWTLDLGKVCESARVSLNGKPVATLFANPFRVPVTDYLKDGKNTLEIEVTNLAANRIADMDRRMVNWKYFNDANVASHPNSRQRGVLDASNWPLFDSGLLGPVTLIPEKEFDPGKK